jgi:hypothetical protein
VHVVGDERQRPGGGESLGGRHDGAHRVGVRVAVDLGEKRTHQREPPAAVRLVHRAAALGHAEAVELARRRGEQARFADPGLAGDVDHAPRAGRHGSDRIGEGGQLTRPPEEDGRHARRE